MGWLVGLVRLLAPFPTGRLIASGTDETTRSGMGKTVDVEMPWTVATSLGMSTRRAKDTARTEGEECCIEVDLCCLIQRVAMQAQERDILVEATHSGEGHTS